MFFFVTYYLLSKKIEISKNSKTLTVWKFYVFVGIKGECKFILACNTNFDERLINGQIVTIMAFNRNDLQLT